LRYDDVAVGKEMSIRPGDFQTPRSSPSGENWPTTRIGDVSSSKEFAPSELGAANPRLGAGSTRENDQQTKNSWLPPEKPAE